MYHVRIYVPDSIKPNRIFCEANGGETLDFLHGEETQEWSYMYTILDWVTFVAQH